ncbi:MAG: ribosome assembly RNA-binding protein YhbY [Chloroflexi bacterium]|nr:ribosome assembly RNA-binding protein YhbY [Chloroflexota bacterium]
MTTLTNTQRKYLKQLAHHLKPSVQIGKAGATESVRASLDQVLSAHELAKVRFIGFKEDKREIAAALAAQTSSELVQIIGHVVIFYRQQADTTKRQVELPA